MRFLDLLALFAIFWLVGLAVNPKTDAVELPNGEHGPGIECHDDPYDFQHQYCAYEI